MQVLVVEDDPTLASALKQALRSQAHSVNDVTTGKAALHVINTETPDLVILDLGLPDMDGIDVLKLARKKHPGLAILVLTARAQLDDKITGLDSGADDYLAKPFDMPELFARIRVLERRRGTAGTSVITLGNVSLDTGSNRITVDGDEVEFPRREFMLLKNLMENAGRVQTRASLEARLYSWGEEVASNALEVHIHHLRKKLGNDFIKTVRGVGYKVSLP